MRRVRLVALVLGILVTLAGIAWIVVVARGSVSQSHRGPRRRVATTHSVIAGPLDGLPTPRRSALRRVIAVVLDNFYPDARPQSGIRSASLVFESLAEGGITRLLALFLEHDANPVGPIRSARPYFVEWAAGYDALLVHAGGAPAALELLYRTPQVANVEALLPLPQFYRTSDRLSPHNLYGSTAGVREIARRNRWNAPPGFPWIRHKKDAPLAKRGPGGRLSITFGTPRIFSPTQYDVQYRYDRTGNVYIRYAAGAPATDASTGRQIEAKNVVILMTRIAPIAGDPEQRVDVGAVGRGRALYCLDGRVVRGTWSKPSVSATLRFWNNKGQRVALNRGQTWIEVVAPGAVRFGP